MPSKPSASTELAIISEQKHRSFDVRKLWRLVRDARHSNGYNPEPDWDTFLKIGDFVEDAMKSTLTVSTNDMTTTIQTNSPNGGEMNT